MPRKVYLDGLLRGGAGERETHEEPWENTGRDRKEQTGKKRQKKHRKENKGKIAQERKYRENI